MKASSCFSLLFAILLGGCVESASKSVTINNGGLHVCEDGQRVVINGEDRHVSITGFCSTVTIGGSRNKIVISSSKRVEIDGPDNRVSVDAADAIRVKSSGNSVRFSKGLTGRSPAVIALGDNNELVQTR